MNTRPDGFYLQGTDAARERFHGGTAVSFEWNIAYACNYRCPYCIFEGKWEEYGPRTAYHTVDEWMTYWQRIFDRYGRASILITGGEPFIYPDFVPLLNRLQALHYPINISSNGSSDFTAFAAACDPQRVSVSLSFHPEHEKLAAVLEKSAFLKRHGFASNLINLCCWPPYVERLGEYSAQAAAAGEKLKVIPFCGTYGGKSYPDSYTAGERRILGMNDSWETNVKRRGTLCAAGQRSALLFPDGKVARCGQIGERHLIGDFFADDFRLMEHPLACDAELCPCLKMVPADEEHRHER